MNLKARFGWQLGMLVTALSLSNLFDRAMSSTLSPDDLAFGLDKLHWGMTVRDARMRYPRLAGPIPQPGQVLFSLAIDDYPYAECIFVVHLIFDNGLLSRVELKADGSANFRACHNKIRADLSKQYSAVPGGIGPSPSLPGSSFHGEWTGSVTDIVYDDLQNAYVDVIFSPTVKPP